MKLNILAFGITKEILGGRLVELEIELDDQARVRDLREALFLQHPELKKLNSLGIAQGSKYAEDSDLLDPTQEIALIPPVSGG
ncbi:MAG: MoaD/ThiS family protein [Saprospiraceae bacterium]|nr:MoaD/ThiS family protein [Saprospiraceae bacterium]